MDNFTFTSVEKSVGKRPLRSLWPRWKDNIKMAKNDSLLWEISVRYFAVN
jgi:hypothetical protein